MDLLHAQISVSGTPGRVPTTGYAGVSLRNQSLELQTRSRRLQQRFPALRRPVADFLHDHQFYHERWPRQR
jgi:hypothetical protein